MNSYLVTKKIKNVEYRFFSCGIPSDLKKQLNNSRRFYLSLNNLKDVDVRFLCKHLNGIAKNLFQEIRIGMRELNLDDIKNILKIEIEKQIMWAQHVDLGTNKYDMLKQKQGLKQVTEQEESLLKKLAQEEKEYNQKLDSKIAVWLQNLEISVNDKSVEYKSLKRHLTDLYLLRHDWARDLINRRDRTTDDFKIEAEKRMNLSIFSDDESKIQNEESAIRDERNFLTGEVAENKSDTDESSPIFSECIDEYIAERNYDNKNTENRVRYELETFIEFFGDVRMSEVDIKKATQFKSYLQKLPRKHRTNSKYKDYDVHTIVEKLDVPKNHRKSVTTINKTIEMLNAFMTYCFRHGHVEKNYFQGLTIKQSIKLKKKENEERDPFSPQDLETIFESSQYLDITLDSSHRDAKPFAHYWVPIIALFTACRANEICSLYHENIQSVKTKNKKTIYYFEINDEESDKKVKTVNSRRRIPIHDSLLDLNFIEFLESLKNFSKQERIFSELSFYRGSYAVNFGKWWNRTALEKRFGIKTERKDFHSFRHSCTDACYENGVDSKFVTQFLGQKHGELSLDRYASDAHVETMYEKCVKKFDYKNSNGRKLNFNKIKISDWSKKMKEIRNRKLKSHKEIF